MFVMSSHCGPARPSRLTILLLPCVAGVAFAAAAAACSPPAPDRTPSPEAAVSDGWITLFDGTSVERWRGFRRDDFPTDGWRVEDGALTPLVGGTVVDLVTRERFADYELELEWRVAPNGNSGIFVHVHEDHPEVWHTGLEFQVLDDARHPDGKVAKTAAGSIYGLVAPVDARPRPAGEWNSARITVRGAALEYTLNGRRIVTVNVGEDSFLDTVRGSGFADIPDFGRRHEGHVALQHSSVSPLEAPVWFRNIRIRLLS